MKFKLYEDKIEEVRLNNHQQHLEDLVLFGKEGLNELNDKIDKFLRRFEGGQGELNLTQKVDGAPALFCWSKFPGYPDNSIALKGFTSGPNTAMSSPEQIDEKYGDRPDMAEKLKLGLELSRYIPKGECWQGDCLFTHDDIREEEIDGQFYLTFQPNKIVYAFKESDPNYDKVRDADFGIAFHTIYRSAGNGEKSQSFNVDPKRINAPDNFYIMSPAINASSSKEDYGLDNFNSTYDELKSYEQKLINDPAYEELVNNSAFMNYWNTFENANLADKKQVNLNVSTLIKDLKSYVRDKQDKEYTKKLDKLKTDKGRQGATDKYNRDVQELADLIDNNSKTITNLVNTLNLAANIKMMMWSGLKNVKNDYSTYYKSRTKGYIPAEGEGIAMSDNDGNIVKIVDRSTFSSYNRDPDIMSGFEHESLDMINNVFDINEDLEKTAVVAFGRMNPPTIGHNKLIDKMASLNGEPKLYLSHSQNDKKDPLPYESKIKWCKKAFGDRVDVVESPARNAFEVLHDLYEEGYTDIIYVGGEDRIGGEDDISASIKKYNGTKTKKGDILYDFNSITFENAGARNPDSNDPKEQASASLVRKLALENNFNEFKKYVPFDSNSAFALYRELRKAMTGKEESFLEACNNRIQQLKEATFSRSAASNPKHTYFNDVINYILTNKSIKLGKNGEQEIDLSNFLTSEIEGGLKKLIGTDDVDTFNDIMKPVNIKWTNIFKGTFSGQKQSDVELLIADAFNNINDSSKPCHSIALVLKENINAKSIKKLENRDGDKPTEVWRNAGAYGEGRIDYTPKTDLISDNGEYRISLKEAAGSQLMSGKFNEGGSEALATLNTTIQHLGKEYTIDKILNVSLNDDDINNTFNVNEVLKSFYENKNLSGKGSVISDIKSGKAGSEQDKKNLEDITNKLNLFAEKLQNLCNNNKVFREEFLKEAATGNIKFGENSKSAANCWFVYNLKKGTAEFYDSWKSFYNNYLETHKIKILVNFKSGGAGSAPWIVIRVLEQ